jgi:hypothetical protein
VEDCSQLVEPKGILSKRLQLELRDEYMSKLLLLLFSPSFCFMCPAISVTKPNHHKAGINCSHLCVSDTEEASETDMGKSEEYIEIKEQ